MKRILLKLFDITVAEIIDKNEITVIDNLEGIIKANELYPLNMREYKKGLSGFVYPIENYFNAINREDVILEANISDNDNVFEKLYKVAGLDIMPINGFSIVQG